jgi:AcrR family transcriptional regulator
MKQEVRRRQPSQSRARKTQLLIFESAARLLEQEGLEGFNTNRLAKLSGFGVGTIYQYFSNKQAILLALAQHEQERALQEVRRLLMTEFASLRADSDFPGVRAIVRAILHTYASRQRAHKILIDLALQTGSHQQLDDPVTALTTLLTSGVVTARAGRSIMFTETDAFVLTQAVIGPIRVALSHDVRLLKKPQFEDALVDLITSFVRIRLGEQHHELRHHPMVQT